MPTPFVTSNAIDSTPYAPPVAPSLSSVDGILWRIRRSAASLGTTESSLSKKISQFQILATGEFLPVPTNAAAIASRDFIARPSYLPDWDSAHLTSIMGGAVPEIYQLREIAQHFGWVGRVLKYGFGTTEQQNELITICIQAGERLALILQQANERLDRDVFLKHSQGVFRFFQAHQRIPSFHSVYIKLQEATSLKELRTGVHTHYQTPDPMITWDSWPARR